MLRLHGRLGSFGAPLGAIALLAGCGGSDLTLPSEAAPADIALIQGNNQTGRAGQPLVSPLVVKVTNNRGEPVQEQRVAFSLATQVPGALVSPDTASTGSDGLAQASWTLGSAAGPQTVVARVVGAGRLEVRFDASVGGSSEPVSIEALSGDGQSAPAGSPLPDSLVVRVLDGSGNPVAGATVEWSAAQGSVDPASVVTGSDGRAGTFRVLGPSTGTQTASASSAGLNGSPVTFTSTAVAAGASRLVRVSGDGQSARAGTELPSPVVVRLVRDDGSGVSGRPVNWLVGDGGGSVSSSTSTTDGSGEAEIRWTMGSSPGTNTLNAVVSGVGVIGFTATATSGGGSAEPARLEFKVQPSDTRKKKKISPPVEVVVLDEDGDRVTDKDIEIKLELIGDRDGKLQGDPSRRSDSGEATFSDLKVEREGEYRLRASADGLPPVDSDRFQVHNEGDEGGDD